jgi:uncharacterized protein YjcR
MTAEDIIYELYRYFQVNNNIDLAEKLKISQQTISNWKSRNSLSAIKKKCRELGIYSEIFSDINSNVNVFEDSNENQTALLENDLSKYFIALESVAVATNKEDELVSDIKELMKKYIG